MKYLLLLPLKLYVFVTFLTLPSVAYTSSLDEMLMEMEIHMLASEFETDIAFEKRFTPDARRLRDLENFRRGGTGAMRKGQAKDEQRIANYKKRKRNKLANLDPEKRMLQFKMAKKYRADADKGNALALSFLGLHYATGKGVLKDRVTAYVLWSLSSSKGNRNASLWLNSLSRIMSKSQIKNAKAIITECNKISLKNCLN